jgi:hypothetical protein
MDRDEHARVTTLLPQKEIQRFAALDQRTIIRGPNITADRPGRGLLNFSALHLRDDFHRHPDTGFHQPPAL